MENSSRSPTSFIAFSKTVGTSPRGSMMQNITNTFQRSIISTSKTKNDNRNMSIEKSKIKTLPNYEKYSMGNNLPFVTIFQTIQIERLSDEVETQRVKIKEYERQLFNTENFEVQIKELSEKCTANETEISEYQEQLDKMNKICQTLYHQNENLKQSLKNTDSSFKSKLDQMANQNKELNEEVQKWVRKHMLVERQKETEVQQIKSMMEKQRKSMIDRQIKDIKIKHESQIAKFQMQIRRLNDLLMLKQRDLEQIKKEYQNAHDYIKELKNEGSKLNQYQYQINLLNQEQFRLSQIIDINTNQLDIARKKQFKLAQQLKSDKELTLDNDHLRQILISKQKEIEKWKQRIVQLEQQVKKAKQQSIQSSQNQTQLPFLYLQIDKQKKSIQTQQKQIQQQKHRLKEQRKLCQKWANIESQNLEWEQKYKILENEKDKYIKMYQAMNKEVEEVKKTNHELEYQVDCFRNFQKDKRNLEQKNKIYAERIKQLEGYVQNVDGQLKQFRQSMHINKGVELTIETLKKENQKLIQQIKNLQSQLHEKANFEKQLQIQSTKLKENQISIKKFQNQVTILEQQIQRLQQLVKVKNQEIVKLQDEKIAKYGMMSQYKNQKATIEEKDRDISKMKSQIDGYRKTLQSYQRKVNQLQNLYQKVESELSRKLEDKESELAKKSKQINEARQKELKLQSQLSENSQLQKINLKQQNRITVYLRDLEDLRSQNKLYETNSNRQKQKIREMQQEIKKLKTVATQYEILRSSAQKSESQSRKSMRSQKSAMAGLCDSKSSAKIDTEKLIERITRLEKMISDLRQKYQELLRQVGSLSTINFNSQNSMIHL